MAAKAGSWSVRWMEQMLWKVEGQLVMLGLNILGEYFISVVGELYLGS